MKGALGSMLSFLLRWKTFLACIVLLPSRKKGGRRGTNAGLDSLWVLALIFAGYLYTS